MGFRDVSDSLGRSGQPRMQATCDDCGREEVFACPRGDVGHARKRIHGMGWRVVKDQLTCRSCQVKRKAEKMATTGAKAKVTPGSSEQPPREPTRAQRREIRDFLEDVYDVDAGCYKAGETDQTVADCLEVLPGWVARIREEWFGDNGGNQDMAALQGDLNRFIQEASQAVADVQGKITEAKSHLVNLEKIQKSVGPRAMARTSK